MSNPTVSFVVPCYKLGHLLPECVNSILAQTYTDFEILIMDDCSPDNTTEVAASFRDDRVKHIRNNPNLGHLKNYNKGIQMARGKYIWLISADDYLRTKTILQRYVETMEGNPKVGYTFCPGVGVKDGRETDVLDYSVYSRHDQIVSGHRLLQKLLERNIVLAASALVRRECYEKLGAFPLDAKWAGVSVDFGWNGDWYLWCLFALHFDVAYLAEPMVCYREHDLSMTTVLTQPDYVESCLAAEIGMLWLIREKAIAAGMHKIVPECLLGIANEYSRQAMSKQYRHATSSITMEECEESLCRSTNSEKERRWIRARLFAGLGDRCCVRGEVGSGKTFYLKALRHDPAMPKVFLKLLLLSLGRPGQALKKLVRNLHTAINEYTYN